MGLKKEIEEEEIKDKKEAQELYEIKNFVREAAEMARIFGNAHLWLFLIHHLINFLPAISNILINKLLLQG